MTSYIDLSTIQKKASTTWEIRSYSNNSESHRLNDKSPIFSPLNDESIKFFLRFSGKYASSITNGVRSSYNNFFYSIALCLQSPIQKAVSVFCKVALLNSYGKFLQREGLAILYTNSNNDPNTSDFQEAQHEFEFIISDSSLITHKVSQYNVKFFCEVFVLDYCNSYQNTRIVENYGTLIKSDVVVVVGNKEFNLHKNILAARSPVFKAMFNSDLEEDKQNRVTITDLKVEVAELIMPYIYTGEIPTMNQYALDLFIASDKYQLEDLKNRCAETLGYTLTVESAAKTLLLADMYGAASLKQKSIEFITKNSEQVKMTKEWSEMLKSKPELLVELYNDLSQKANPLLK